MGDMGKNPADRNSNGSFVSAAFILGVSSLLSRLVGLFQQRIFATTYGAGDVYDAYLAAFRIPDVIFNLVTIGALSAAFIPLFTEKLVKGGQDERRAFAFASSILNILVLVVAVFSLVYAVFAPWIVPFITPGFKRCIGPTCFSKGIQYYSRETSI